MQKNYFSATNKTKISRLAKRGNYEKNTIYQILDEQFVCTVAFCKDNIPFQIPTLFCRKNNSIFIHASVGAGYIRFFENLEVEVNICVSILDGLVLARSAFHHSANYRSVVIFSKPKIVKSPKKVLEILKLISDKIHPERWSDVRLPNKKELMQTVVVEFPINDSSAKLRTGPPIDDEIDYDSKYWAGIIPIETKRGIPIPDPKLNPKIKLPKYLK